MPGKQYGWREKVAPGIYRMHKLSCNHSETRKPTGGRSRCDCSWRLNVPGPNGTRSVTFKGNLSEAKDERARLVGQAKSSREEARPAPPSEGETLADFAQEFMRSKRHTLAPNTLEGYWIEYRVRIHPHLGSHRLDEIDRDAVETWKAGLLEDMHRNGRAPRMARQAVAVLRTILAEAVSRGRMHVNPARNLDLPPLSPDGVAAERAITEQQLALLLATGATRARRRGDSSREHSHRLETMIRAAGETGLRRGEIAALRWTDIDLGERRIRVRRSGWETLGGRMGEKETKGRRARTLAISSTFAEALGAWAEESITKLGNLADGWVWPGRDGTRMRTRSVYRAVDGAVRRAGLLDGNGKPLVTVHGLRHTCGSIMLLHGVPLIVVSRYLGHRDPRVTADVYAHLLDPDTEYERIAEIFEEIGPNSDEATRKKVRGWVRGT